jgi:K+-transporting ATPase ATPase C chain
MELVKSTESGPKYRPAIVLSILSLLLCGLIFPLIVTGLSQAILPYQANGSPAQLGGRTVGSYYIANGFTLPIFFHTRNESNPLTASASGVDPDITLNDALSQVARIHSASGVPASNLTSIVMSHVQMTFPVFGNPYVNVLALNLALVNSFPNVYSQYR